LRLSGGGRRVVGRGLGNRRGDDESRRLFFVRHLVFVVGLVVDVCVVLFLFCVSLNTQITHTESVYDDLQIRPEMEREKRRNIGETIMDRGRRFLPTFRSSSSSLSPLTSERASNFFQLFFFSLLSKHSFLSLPLSLARRRLSRISTLCSRDELILDTVLSSSSSIEQEQQQSTSFFHQPHERC